jgi:HEPN domain-containing protein
MKVRTREWIEFADKDWEVVECIKDNQRLDSMIAFHGQQMTEKYIKAVLEEYNVVFKRIHKLALLYNLLPVIVSQKIIIPEEFLYILDSVYIDTRYPADLGLLPNGEMSNSERAKFLNIITELHNIFEKYFSTI